MTRALQLARNRRRGGAMVVAIVALLVVSLMAATLLKSLLLLQRQSRRAEQQMQALWLAEAALQRAAAMVAKDEKFTGETWNVDLPACRGVAVIQVANVENEPEQRAVSVVARYPDEPVHRALVERTLIVELAR